MPEIPEAVRLLAAEPNAHTPLWPGSQRFVQERFVLWIGPPMYPGLTTATVLRLGSDVDGGVAAVRALAREHGRRRTIFMASPYSDPDDLGPRLLEAGLHADIDPVLHVLVLGHEPEGVEGVDVRRVDSFERFEHFFDVQAEAFGTERDVSDGGRARLAEVWDGERACDFLTTYVAYVDGRPVSTARATFCEHGVVLNSGATVPDARGNGLYRALVRARWDDAVARGTPYLTTLARPMSDPILRRLGFQHLGDVHVFTDDLD